jgi:hypothetical protein
VASVSGEDFSRANSIGFFLEWTCRLFLGRRRLPRLGWPFPRRGIGPEHPAVRLLLRSGFQLWKGPFPMLQDPPAASFPSPASRATGSALRGSDGLDHGLLPGTVRRQAGAGGVATEVAAAGWIMGTTSQSVTKSIPCARKSTAPRRGAHPRWRAATTVVTKSQL